MADGRGGTNTRGDAAGRAGMRDVAQRAGVGIATVGRVLNERGHVSPATAKRVLDAARELGLRRILPLPHRPVLRFEVLLAHPHSSFLTRLNHGFAKPGGHARPHGRRSADHHEPLGTGARRGQYPPPEIGRTDRPCGGARRCPRRDRRGDGRRHAGGLHGDGHPRQRADGLCGHRQREGRPHGRPSRRPHESSYRPSARS